MANSLNQWFANLVLVMVTQALYGCTAHPFAQATKKNLRAHDAVLSEGHAVKIKNPNGEVRVDYVSDFIRKYTINGQSYTVKLEQREEEFRGQKGLINPGNSWGTNTRFVIEESVIRFTSKEALTRFFEEGAEFSKWVSGENGLVAGYRYTPERFQVSIELFRCYLDGIPISSIPEHLRHGGIIHMLKQ